MHPVLQRRKLQGLQHQTLVPVSKLMRRMPVLILRHQTPVQTPSPRILGQRQTPAQMTLLRTPVQILQHQTQALMTLRRTLAWKLQHRMLAQTALPRTPVQMTQHQMMLLKRLHQKV